MEEKNTAKTIGKELPISTKQSVEICNFIRHKTTEQSKRVLEEVLQLKTAVPYKRYVKHIPHRKGKIATGRYPVKAVQYVLDLIKNVEANAKNQGLETPLVIDEVIANKGTRGWHHGRIRRIKNKRTHIKIVVRESKQAGEKKDKK